ncbi:acyl-CoA dehydrogenase family protein [Bacillus thermotolerans]|uniref:Butyryl-CoA dehydrogenase n=1 Tax=Bacillus thermotolerans TaxID=1221996 RepID=A0A0F5ICP2_BACTR|nr:acyl-CoA dehydrogenase family protein [Bacillus thermotolerans]KKB42947.1 Butyryl-CoA dehydrogenase [Bacillus thermotolerans]KKB43855.1 Butyryl-CoA dehydrogenase [Bacillus thermotolerans]
MRHNFQELSILGKLKEKTSDFQKRESQLDELNSFPYDNFNDLKKMGYTKLTLPKEFGGGGSSLSEFLACQEQIAKGCGSTALTIGWHMGAILEFAEHRHWNNEVVSFLTKELRDGALINTAASERNAGSPLRGAKPSTTAQLSADGQYYVITGEKTFTSGAPVLDYLFVTASIENDDRAGVFLVSREAEGVSIRETWDSVAMRGTASHDLIMKEVKVPAGYLNEYVTEEKKSRRTGWTLHIPACYLGIAGAARDYAVKFAAGYRPASLGKPIGTVPAIQQQIGEMDTLLLASRHFLYGVAEQYEQHPHHHFKEEIGTVKTFVTNQAITVVDLAMRIVGARSLSEKNPLHRYWQNVRAGLHNPPMDDITYKMLAERAMKETETE